jgi:hypothetical protein
LTRVYVRRSEIGNGVSLILRRHEADYVRQISGVLLAVEDGFLKIKTRRYKMDFTEGEPDFEESEIFLSVSEIGQFGFSAAEAALDRSFHNVGVW